MGKIAVMKPVKMLPFRGWVQWFIPVIPSYSGGGRMVV
jgi:hypothetical protein